MKCVKLTDVKKLELAEMEKPVSVDGSVVFKVESAGICGSDIHNWDNGQPKGLVLGHEFAGTVVDPGSRSDLKVGDRITGLPISPCGVCSACKNGSPQYCAVTWNEAVGLALTNSGGYAEYSSCRADLVKKLPDNVSFDEGCMVEPSAVSLHAVNLADIKVGDRVLIVGAGIIGLMAAEFAKLDGASYIAMIEVNSARGEKSKKYGFVNEYFDAKDEKVLEKLVVASNGGFDKVIECCGNSAAVSEAIMAVRPGGTVVLVGVSTAPITVPMVMAVMREVKLQGAIAYTETEFEDVIRLISEKVIDVEKYIDARVGLEKAQESFERLTSGSDDAIKIVFKP